MAVFNTKQIQEINEVIAEIEKVIKPKNEIGAHDKASLAALMKSQDSSKKISHFKCKPEYSDTIVTHFVKEKKLVKHRYHKNNQSNIFVLK